MTKADKDMGIVKKSMRPLPNDKATPKSKGKKERGRYGYICKHAWGGRTYQYVKWFVTVEQRDQSLSAAIKSNDSHKIFSGFDKTERK